MTHRLSAVYHKNCYFIYCYYVIMLLFPFSLLLHSKTLLTLISMHLLYS